MVSKLSSKGKPTLSKKQPGKSRGGHPPREDLERIESDYRAGILTLREIGQLHGVSHTRIAQYARAQKWTRDLSHKVKAAAQAKLAAPTLPSVLTEKFPALKMTEDQTVEAGAQVIASVVLEHRANIRKARSLAVGMLAELEDLGGDQETLQQAAAKALEGLGHGDTRAAKAFLGRLEDVMQLGARAGNLTQVVNVLDRSISMERRAFDLDKDGGNTPPPPAEQPPAGPSAALLALRARVLSVVNGREKSDEAT